MVPKWLVGLLIDTFQALCSNYVLESVTYKEVTDSNTQFEQSV